MYTSGMGKRIDRRSRSANPAYHDQHRYEHWLVDNQVYFITARCRNRRHCFASDCAKEVFWDRFTHWTSIYGFVPWVTSLIDNHYHTLGYLKESKGLPELMRRFHGSVAKLTNDTLKDRHVPFWREAWGKQYFDGCIRDETQARRAFRYTLTQSVRHGLVQDWRKYPHTRVNVELERAIKRAQELKGFLEGVPYKRYLDGRRS